MSTSVTAGLAAIVGAAVGYVDSRPTWDDTGITAGTLFLASLILGLWRPGHWWLWALLVGLGVPAMHLVSGGGIASAFALLFAIAGGGLGAVGRRLAR